MSIHIGNKPIHTDNLKFIRAYITKDFNAPLALMNTMTIIIMLIHTLIFRIMTMSIMIILLLIALAGFVALSTACTTHSSSHHAGSFGYGGSVGFPTGGS